MSIVSADSFKLSFNNEHVIYENYITVHINQNEFNLSYNPSLRETGSNSYSNLKDFVTGSNFYPYATTLGLYNDDNDLIMVAKFSTPLPIPLETDMNILIRYDS